MSTIENELMRRIAGAGPEELRQIRDVDLPHLGGLSEEERQTVHCQIGLRFAFLNAEAAGPQRQREPGRCKS